MTIVNLEEQLEQLIEMRCDLKRCGDSTKYKEVQRKIRRLQQTLWQRNHYNSVKRIPHSKSLVYQLFQKPISELTTVERRKYNAILQANCRARRIHQ